MLIEKNAKKKKNWLKVKYAKILGNIEVVVLGI